MRRTALYEAHVEGGGKLVEFAGYEMPLHYGDGILAEHRAVRSDCGLFDVSHMGRLDVSGPGAFPTLQRLATNDLSRLADGGVQYNHICREDGGVLDDVLISRLAVDAWGVVCNASNHEKIRGWLESHAPADLSLADRTEASYMIAVQGPRAAAVLQPVVSEPLASLRYYHGLRAHIGPDAVVVSRTGYTGEDGFEVIGPAGSAASLWKRLVGAGARPCGLGARDTLRLEAGMPLYGHELSEDGNPLEASLDWVVKLSKGEFIGRDAIRRAQEAGLSRRLCGFEVAERGAIPRQGYPILSDGREVGRVTSGILSPTLSRNIGMAYVPPPLARPEASFAVSVRGRQVPARVLPLPFYKRKQAA